MLIFEHILEADTKAVLRKFLDDTAPLLFKRLPHLATIDISFPSVLDPAIHSAYDDPPIRCDEIQSLDYRHFCGGEVNPEFAVTEERLQTWDSLDVVC